MTKQDIKQMTKDTQNTKDIAKGKVIGTQNTKDIISSEKDIAKGAVAGLKNTKDIHNSQIDIVNLFERVVRIEAKLDMANTERRSNDNWIRTFLLIVVAIELINLVMNYIMISLHS